MGLLQKVKAKKLLLTDNGIIEKGQEVSLDPELASKLIELGKAESVKETKAEKSKEAV